MWCVAELTPEYIEKMEDTLGLYEKPHDLDQPVVCLDEKPISLHDDVRRADGDHEARVDATAAQVLEVHVPARVAPRLL